MDLRRLKIELCHHLLRQKVFQRQQVAQDAIACRLPAPLLPLLDRAAVAEGISHPPRHGPAKGERTQTPAGGNRITVNLDMTYCTCVPTAIPSRHQRPTSDSRPPPPSPGKKGACPWAALTHRSVTTACRTISSTENTGPGPENS